MNRFHIVLLCITASFLAFLPPAQAGAPCCAVTNIAKDGRVTAREVRGTRTFQFRVADRPPGVDPPASRTAS